MIKKITISLFLLMFSVSCFAKCIASSSYMLGRPLLLKINPYPVDHSLHTPTTPGEVIFGIIVLIIVMIGYFRCYAEERKERKEAKKKMKADYKAYKKKIAEEAAMEQSGIVTKPYASKKQNIVTKPGGTGGSNLITKL